MKRYILLTVAASFLIILAGCANKIVGPEKPEQNQTPTEKQVISSSRQFGINLFKELSNDQKDSNIFISPLSISTAFGMVLNGAAGQTYDDIKNTLELSGGTAEQINSAYKDLNNKLQQADPEVIFSNANSIWYRQGFSVKQNFIDVNKNYFNALVQGLDFSDPSSVNTINNWVDENTNGKIKSIIKTIPASTVMYLINAIYFKGTWLYGFDSTATKQDNFYTSPNNPVTCSMMNQKDSLNYSSSDGYQAVELPYGNGDFGMYIILPSAEVDVNNFIGQLDDNFWNGIIDNMKNSEVNLWLPKFKLNYKIDLINALTNLGMGIAFDPARADFSNISGAKNLVISSVLHKTYIDVNEKGTEAAAVTSIGVTVTAALPHQDNIYMRVDHPFIFAIRENTTGTILFIGKVMNPEAN